MEKKQAPAQGGVTEAMVEEGLSYFEKVGDAGDKLYVEAIREHITALEAALSAQQGQGELQPEDSRCPPTYRREEAVKALIAMDWSWDGKQWSAPPAQPAERVPEGWVPREVVEVAQGDLHMLKKAIEARNPWSELLARASVTERDLRAALAATPTSAAQGQPGGNGGEG